MATSATTELWSLLAAHSPAPQGLNGQRPTILELTLGSEWKFPHLPKSPTLRHTGLWAPLCASLPVIFYASSLIQAAPAWFPGFSSTSNYSWVLRAPTWCLVGAGFVCTELPDAANSSCCTNQFNAAKLVKTLEKPGASTASGNQFHMYPVTSHCNIFAQHWVWQMIALHTVYQKKSPLFKSHITFSLWDKRFMPGWYEEVTATEHWGTKRC